MSKLAITIVSLTAVASALWTSLITSSATEMAQTVADFLRALFQ